MGAGTGAVGLWIAARWPTSRVTLTDLAEALPLLRANAALNGFGSNDGRDDDDDCGGRSGTSGEKGGGGLCGPEPRVRVRELPFGAPVSSVSEARAGGGDCAFDAIVAADVLYSVRSDAGCRVVSSATSSCIILVDRAPRRV